MTAHSLPRSLAAWTFSDLLYGNVLRGAGVGYTDCYRAMADSYRVTGECDSTGAYVWQRC